MQLRASCIAEKRAATLGRKHKIFQPAHFRTQGRLQLLQCHFKSLWLAMAADASEEFFLQSRRVKRLLKCLKHLRPYCGWQAVPIGLHELDNFWGVLGSLRSEAAQRCG